LTFTVGYAFGDFELSHKIIPKLINTLHGKMSAKVSQCARFAKLYLRTYVDK